MTPIPKYLSPRHDIPLKNKYYLSNDDENIFFVLYYINFKKAKISIRNLNSETGWNIDLHFKIFDNTNEESFVIPKQGKNSLITYITLNVVKLEPVEFKEQKIPKRIIQTFWSDYAQSVLHYNTILSLIELNPEYEYVFYNDQMCRELIKNNFPKNVLIAYDTLTSGSFKSDIFRACYLYLYGGCYFDCKLINKTPIREFIDPNDEVILCSDSGSKIEYYNAIIFTIPKQRVLLDFINNNVFLILKKSYNNFYDLFGPTVLFKCVQNLSQYQREKIKVKFNHVSPKVIDIKTSQFLTSGFNKDYRINYLKGYYETLFKTHNLYYKLIYIGNYIIKLYPTSDVILLYIKNRKLIIQKNNTKTKLKLVIVNNKNSKEMEIETIEDNIDISNF
ncbi:MAG: glycosyltransferase [Candidatus Micrarchaeaceae archaeon]